MLPSQVQHTKAQGAVSGRAPHWIRQSSAPKELMLCCGTPTTNNCRSLAECEKGHPWGVMSHGNPERTELHFYHIGDVCCEKHYVRSPQIVMYFSFQYWDILAYNLANTQKAEECVRLDTWVKHCAFLPLSSPHSSLYLKVSWERHSICVHGLGVPRENAQGVWALFWRERTE